MPRKHTFELADDTEEKWEQYEKENDSNFSKMANSAIREYLNRKLEKKR